MPAAGQIASVVRECERRNPEMYYRERQADTVLSLLAAGEHEPTFGYQINNYQYCLQAATMLHADGYDEETTVVVGLLHDVGFLACPERHGAFAAELLGGYVSDENYGCYGITRRLPPSSPLMPRTRNRNSPGIDGGAIRTPGGQALSSIMTTRTPSIPRTATVRWSFSSQWFGGSSAAARSRCGSIRESRGCQGAAGVAFEDGVERVGVSVAVEQVRSGPVRVTRRRGAGWAQVAGRVILSRTASEQAADAGGPLAIGQRRSVHRRVCRGAGRLVPGARPAR
jgi:hypothetical protein